MQDVTRIDRASRLPSNVELALYRIAQEALTNALRHSGAATVLVRADLSPTQATIDIRDDGVGIDPVAARGAARRGRMGLASMSQRARLIGADLVIEPLHPGTSVRVRWAA
jgi:two-component system NarL family sensor kinase